jgi:hypothetical protein
MLCEICQKKDATCHICIIVNGVSKSRNLCVECYKASSPEASEFIAAQMNGRCEYCGAHSTTGAASFIEKLETGRMPVLR